MHVASVRWFELARGLVFAASFAMVGCSERRQPAVADGPGLAAASAPAVSVPAVSAPAASPVVHERVDGLTVGSEQVCAPGPGGRFRCWDFPFGAPKVIDSLGGVSDPVSLAAGSGFVCALSAAGEVGCQQQPGASGTPAPQRIGFRRARQISASFDQVCALEEDGTVACSGCLLPTCFDTEFTGLMPVRGIAKAARINVKRRAGCAVLVDGTARCWFNTREGPLAKPPRGAIEEVAALQGVLNVALGGHWCAALADGSVVCMGDNTYGQMGGSQVVAGAPQAVPGLTAVVHVTATNTSTCALNRDGRVYCWGLNSRGDLGDGTMADRGVPALVPGLDEVEELASDGFLQTCARRRDTSVWCWGAGLLSPTRLKD